VGVRVGGPTARICDWVIPPAEHAPFPAAYVRSCSTLEDAASDAGLATAGDMALAVGVDGACPDDAPCRPRAD
jgi:hypothetical protein